MIVGLRQAIFFQVGGTAISWRSRKQTCIALSTVETEYIALSQAVQEAESSSNQYV